MLTHERVRHLLDYDPNTGIFTWKVTRNGISAGKTSGAQVGRPAGSPDKNGYLVICLDGKKYWAARLAFFWMTGQWPRHDADHRNRNPSNNQWTNLRDATTSQNMQNKRIQKNNSVGLKGVGRHKIKGIWTGKYRARIKTPDRHLHLGLFDCPAAANLAYVVAADIHFGEFARS